MPSIKRLARRTCDGVLGGVGLELHRKGYGAKYGPHLEAQCRRHSEQETVYRGKYQGVVDRYRSTIAEMEGCFRERVFADLPPRAGRHELMTELLGTQISEAFYVLTFLHRSLSRPGDVCEFGVAQGATSALLANEIRDTAKRLWLFDSFQGLPRPSAKDVLLDDIFNLGSMDRYAGTMACPVEQVRGRLANLGFPPDRVRIVPGFIEEVVRRGGLPEQVCFAYVDFDFYEPIRTALEVLDERLSVGGAVVVDDYGFFSAGAQAAVDEFVQAHPGRYEFTAPYPFAGAFAVLTRRVPAAGGRGRTA